MTGDGATGSDGTDTATGADGDDGDVGDSRSSSLRMIGSSTGSSGRRTRRMMGSSWFMVAVRKESDGVASDGDLFPVRAVADGETRHRTRAARAQVNEAAREFRGGDTSGNRRRDVRERGDLQLFAGAKFLETAGYFFAHDLVDG